MLHVYKIKEWRDKLFAVNHNDNTGRLQTVKRDENPLYYDLVKSFEKKQACLSYLIQALMKMNLLSVHL